MGPYPPQPPPGPPGPPGQPGPPGYLPPYPPPMMPQAIYTPPPQNDGKAIASLVLGILSLVACFGALAGIPAIILGFLSKRDIARSGGALGGDGLALGGIITGILSTVGSIVLLIVYVGVFAAIASSTPKYTPSPYTPYVPPTAIVAPTSTATTPPAPTALKPMPFTGVVRVIDVRPAAGPLVPQLAAEIASAKADGDRSLVITASRKCPACDEVFDAFANYQLQAALVDVRVIRVDVDGFKSDVAALGLDKPAQPWFYKMDASLKILDAISADEWDDNDAWNITPVLKSFMAGTYKKRVLPDAGLLGSKPALSDPF